MPGVQRLGGGSFRPGLLGRQELWLCPEWWLGTGFLRPSRLALLERFRDTQSDALFLWRSLLSSLQVRTLCSSVDLATLPSLVWVRTRTG